MRADRLVAIVLLLQARGRLTVAELAERLEASERTIRRDLDALCAAGVPVLAQRGRGGGWELLGGHRTDLSGLSGPEIEALFLVAGPEAVAAGLGVEPGLRSALRKLLAALPEPLRARADTVVSRVLVDPEGWGSQQGPPVHLAALREAVISGTQVELTYASPRRAASTRRVEPFGLVSKRGSWYLLAGTEIGLRTFRVSRVEGVTPTGAAVRRPDRFDLEAEWARVREAVPQSFPSVAVEILLDPRAEPHLAAALAGWARLEPAPAHPEDEPRHRLVAHLPNYQIAARELARFGESVEVVGPPEARGEMRRLGLALVTGYGEPALDRLAGAAVRRRAAELRSAAEEQLGGDGDPLQRIAGYLRREREPLRGCRIGRLTQDQEALADPRLREPIAETFTWLRQRLTELVAEAQGGGELADQLDPEETAAAIAAVVQGGYVLARASGDAEAFRTATAGLLRLLAVASAPGR